MTVLGTPQKGPGCRVGRRDWTTVQLRCRCFRRVEFGQTFRLDTTCATHGATTVEEVPLYRHSLRRATPQGAKHLDVLGRGGLPDHLAELPATQTAIDVRRKGDLLWIVLMDGCS